MCGTSGQTQIEGPRVRQTSKTEPDHGAAGWIASDAPTASRACEGGNVKSNCSLSIENRRRHRRDSGIPPNQRLTDLEPAILQRLHRRRSDWESVNERKWQGG